MHSIIAPSVSALYYIVIPLLPQPSMFCFWCPWNQWHNFIVLLLQLNISGQLRQILSHREALSPHNKKPYCTEMKKKARELWKYGVPPLSPPSVVIDIGGLILHLELPFLKWGFFFPFFFPERQENSWGGGNGIGCVSVHERAGLSHRNVSLIKHYYTV